MKTYFISGHRDITLKEFQQHYAKEIMNVVLRDHTSKFVVGDYYGVDQMAQDYLWSLKQKYVDIEITVYHMLESARNNENGFPTLGGFKNDHDRDSQMTLDSDEDIAWVRAGKSNSGTAQNLLRRKFKTLAHEMKYQDADEFLDGFSKMLLTHPDKENNIDSENYKGDEMNLEEEVKKSEITIVKYYADWCGPCKMMTPIVNKIGDERENVNVISINIDEETELVQKNNIASVPTLAFYKNGVFVKNTAGAMPEPAIVKVIEEL